ncbi:hypothetical protein PilKf_01394 [Pillotina sp. SPG140]
MGESHIAMGESHIVMGTDLGTGSVPRGRTSALQKSVHRDWFMSYKTLNRCTLTVHNK